MAESVAPKSVGQSGGDATPQLQGLVGSSGCPLVGGSAPREVYQVRMVCISTINQSSFNIIFIRYSFSSLFYIFFTLLHFCLLSPLHTHFYYYMTPLFTYNKSFPLCFLSLSLFFYLYLSLSLAKKKKDFFRTIIFYSHTVRIYKSTFFYVYRINFDQHLRVIWQFFIF